MAKHARICAAAVLCALLLAAPATALSGTLTGTVVGVSDGDTITVLDASLEQHKIRVAGIDAPEKAQPFGRRSKESLSRILYGKRVDIEWHKRDRYRRIVGKVSVADPGCRVLRCAKTIDAGLAQVSAGLAWWYRTYARDQSADDGERYAFAEREARSRRVGLWSDREPTPPWEWRRVVRER